MNNNNITYQQSLELRIQALQSLEYDQFNALKNNINTITKNNHPISIGKKIFTEFVDINSQSNTIKDAGLITIADFLIGKIIGKYRSANRFMLSMFIQKLTSFLIIKSNK